MIKGLEPNMLGAEIIAKTLKSIGVKRVFLFPGGTIAPLLDALVNDPTASCWVSNSPKDETLTKLFIAAC